MERSDLPLNTLTFTVLDFETTGTVKGFESLPWQIGAVTLTHGALDLTQWRLDSLLRVPADYPFSRHAPGTHRTQREAIAQAPAVMDVWPHLHARLAATIPVAHNIVAERTTLRKLAPLTRYPLWVDTLRLVRTVYPDLPSHALEEVIPALGLQERLEALCPERAPHDAYYDAIAAALLLEHFLALPGWERLTLGDIAIPD